MSKDARSQKLDSIARCLSRIEQKRPASVSALENDVDIQEILILNLERLVQLTADCAVMLISEKNWLPLPDSMAASFEVLARQNIITADVALRLKKAVGFRNLCVHEYDKINWKIVYAVISSHLDDFRNFARAMDAQN